MTFGDEKMDGKERKGIVDSTNIFLFGVFQER